MSGTPRRLAGPPRARYWVLAVLAAAAFALILYSVYGTRQRTPLRVGQASPQEFVAPVDTQVIDMIATQRERQSARSQIEPVYTPDPQVTALVLAAITSSGLPTHVVDEVISRYRAAGGVRASELPGLVDELVAQSPPERQREVRLVLDKRLVANSVPNDRLTQVARDAAAAAVAPVMQSLEAGQVIVRAGEPLTEDQLRVLDSLGLYSARTEAATQTAWIVVGVALLSLLLLAPLVVARVQLSRAMTFRKIAFLVALTLGILALQRVALDFSAHFLFALLVPLVVAALLGPRLALPWAAWMALAMGIMVPAAPLYAVAGTLIGGAVAALMVRSAGSRLTLLLAGSVGGLAAALSLVALVLVGGGMPMASMAAGAMLLVAGGVLAGVLALGLLPIAEGGFGFLTDFRLTELSSPSNPLLQRLITEAPGTYQHSLIISNLVDQAVNSVGGNALLARVGALYHDVGKIKRPGFFVENQFSGDNPHDRISPHLSYLIVTSHVRDGVELLQEYHLPEELLQFVEEHHGTTVLSYFYKRALDEGEVEELNFRYPGPKPRSKETGILMLADAVESASRTLTDPTPTSIRSLIDKLIKQRLQDGQLDETPLTFNDIEVIAATFQRMLTAILHRRITYPSADELKGLKRSRSERFAAVSGGHVA
ncbi:MAG: HDIG domain-containing protein [Truepera sp.]|nr:HDIG domain-containing protein [Truepera sp.]